MFKQNTQVSILTLLTALAATNLSAANQTEIVLPGLGTDSGNEMRGGQLRNQLMSAEERSSFQSRMRSANSREEREAIRTEQRAVITERANAQGIALPGRSQSGGKGMSHRRDSAIGGGMGRSRF